MSSQALLPNLPIRTGRRSALGARLSSRVAHLLHTALLIGLAVAAQACGGDISGAPSPRGLLPRTAALEYITPASGEFFQINNGGTVYMVYNGAYYGIPSWETFQACAGGSRSGMIHNIPAAPALTYAGVIPDVNTYPWTGRSGPVKNPATNTLYAIRGCVKSGFATWDSFVAEYGAQEPYPDVPAAVLDQLPTGPVVSYPLYPVGTLIKGSGGEVRMVTHGGGALGVPSPQVLASHCQFVVAEVSDAAFQAYGSEGVLHTSSTTCPQAVPAMLVVPDFRVPLPTNDYWLLSVEIGTATSSCGSGVGGRFYGGGYDCYHSGTGKYALDLLPKVRSSTGSTVTRSSVPVLAAAAGTAYPGYNAGGYGNYVRVEHSNGFSTYYAHLARIDVASGAAVSKGQTLGIMGTTGNSTGVHLHFETRYNAAGATQSHVLDQVLVGRRKLSDFRVGTTSSPTYYWSGT